MAVYVDDMHLTAIGRYGRMKMCHMIADTDQELHEMADRIGVSRRWWQSPESSSGSHYDIAMTKRVQAVQAGAIEISLRQCAAMNFRRRVSGALGVPVDAEEWLGKWRAARAAQEGNIHG